MSLPDAGSKWEEWLDSISEQEDVNIELNLDKEERRAAVEVLEHTEANGAERTLKNRKTALKQWLLHLADEDNHLIDSANKSRPVSRFKTRFLNAEPPDGGDEGYSPRSVRQKLYAISAVYNVLAELDYVDSNPTEDVNIKELSQTRREVESPREYITVEEYRELVEGANRLRDQIIVKLLFQTGVRAGEAVKITREDIDMPNRTIEVKTVKTGEHSNTETRNVYIRRSLRRDLRRYFNDGHRLAYPPATDSYPRYLLVSKQQQQMQPQRISEILHEIASQDSVELEHYDAENGMYTDAGGATRHWLSAHLLRKSYAVHRVRGGMPVVYLTDTMGHADVETTKERYLDYRDDDIREADEGYSPLS